MKKLRGASVDDAYERKMTKDLEFCATTKSLRSGDLGFCEHPECQDTISFSPEFIWSDRRCTVCRNEGRGDSRFLPSARLLASIDARP